jgi:type II secretory pathway pseudopilin PulG
VARFRGEEGLTIVELLVVTALLGVLGMAVLGIYSVSERVYARASSLEDAQLEARGALDRIVTDLKLAGSHLTGILGAGPPIDEATATSITIVGDLDEDTLDGAGAEIVVATSAVKGDREIVVNRTDGVLGVNAFTAREYVSLTMGSLREVKEIAPNYRSGTALPLAVALVRTYVAGSIVRSVERLTYAFDPRTRALTRTVGARASETILENVVDLTLTYFDQDGAVLPPPPDLADITEIRVSLTTQGQDGSRRTMMARVRPPNLRLPE